MIRLATSKDIPLIAAIYEDIHTEEEAGRTVIGWARGVYPTEATAQAALERGDLFVLEDGGELVGAAVINRQQVDVYAQGEWQYSAPDDEVMVLHTLVISPKAANKGYGRQFAAHYEQYAAENGCTCLRIDTNARNLRARSLYKKLGYREAGIVPCVFNGLKGVELVLLEKKV